MKCLNCGKAIANDSVFCEFCGKKVSDCPEETIVDDSGKVEGKNPSQKPVEKPKRKKKWLWPVGAGVAMIAVVLFLNIFKNYENYAQSFSEGLAFAEIKGKAGYIDKSGEMVITLPQYDICYTFHEGWAAVRDKESGLWGYIDKAGRQIVVPQYTVADDFSEGLAHVRTTEWEHFFINKNGQKVISLGIGVGVGSFHEGMARVDGCCVDSTGRIVLRPSVSDDRIEDFYERTDLVDHCFIDRTGKIVLLPSVSVDRIGDFHEGLAAVLINGKVGYIDKTGNLVISPKYDDNGNTGLFGLDDNYSFSESLAVVLINGKYGYIDKTSNWVIPPRYEHASNFSEGLAAVSINGEFGYIDRAGNLIISPQYGSAYEFSDGMARVTKGGIHFIDKNGNKVLTIR